MQRLRTVTLLALCTAVSAAVPALRAQSQGFPATPALDSLIAKHMADAGMVGFSAAVIVKRQVVWMKGYGFADWQRTRPFTPNTIMNVASIAKTFLGVAMMRAVKEGKLSLDADINTYLPFRVVNPHHPTAKITLRHLATHTSGITDRSAVYAGTYRYDGSAPEPLGRFLAKYFTPGSPTYARDNFLDATPGAQREYCNIGAALAGYIVERAVRKPLNVYVRTHVFTPLGMTRSGYRMSEVDMSNHSRLFVSQNGSAVPILHYSGVTYPDGGVRSSVADLSKFFIAMLRGGELQGARILDADMAAEMQRFQFNDTNRPENFPAADGNSGLFWRTRMNGTLVGHGGNDPGVEAEMLSDLAGEVSVIYLSNTSLSGTDRRASGAISTALWQFAGEEHARRKAGQ